MLPSVHIVGYTAISYNGLREYLQATGRTEFLRDVADAKDAGLSDGEILCSLFAKVCYASVVQGQNLNIKETRDIASNLRGCYDMGHGSVFEHACVNFIASNVSRVFTHELVRHRAGTAFSQTSGRYVRTDKLELVEDPILAQYDILSEDEASDLRDHIEAAMRAMSERIDRLSAPRDLKKKLTSAVRRWLPNGQANEIAFSLNFRTIRHTVQVRTSRHAEWEIRTVFNSVYEQLKSTFPLLFHGAKEELVDGLLEVAGMRMQPYDAA